MTDLESRLAVLSPKQLELLRARLRTQPKAEPVRPAAPPPIEPRPEERFAPFPLTEVQQAYWIGRSGLYDLGAGGANSYMEYDLIGADGAFLDRLEWAIQEFIRRHDMMRAVVLPDGDQQVLREVPPFRIERVDLRGRGPAEAEAEVLRARERLCTAKGRTGQRPLFDVLAHYLDGHRIRLHLRFDALLKDGRSRSLLLEELPVLFNNPDAELTALECTYRDFAVSRAVFEETELFRRSRDYWMERLGSLPPAPEMPLAADLGPGTLARFQVDSLDLLPRETWQRLKGKAARAGITPSSLALAAWVETVAAWSGSPRFTLGLFGTDRPPVHPQIEQIFGNFNTLYLLGVDDPSGTFRERALRVQARLTADLENRWFSGFQVLRELNRRAGSSRAAVPIFFNSVLDHAGPDAEEEDVPWETAPAADGEERGEEVRRVEVQGNVHPPQILVLPTLLELRGVLVCKWQAVEEVFPEGLLRDLLAGYARLLERLAAEDALWDAEGLGLAAPERLAAREPRPDLDPRLRMGPGDRVLTAADPFLLDPLLDGAAILEAGEAPAAGEERATVWAAPPARVEQWAFRLERDPGAARPPLRLALLVVQREDTVPLGLPRRLRALFPGIEVAILGTLDRSSAVACHLLREGEEDDPARPRLPWGRPLPGRSLQVLDHHLAPRPDWVAGDLWAGAAGDRPSPTGLRARVLPGGEIDILGRPDACLLDLAGRRIEPRRVEAALERLPGVRAAVVLPRRDGDGRMRLHAFVLTRDGRAEGLPSALEERLPPHLVPADIELLTELPLTASGEVDRAALAAAVRPAPAPVPAAPRDPLEAELAEIWRDLLGEAPASVTDDFFALGGNSLLAVRLMDRLAARFGLREPLPRFFNRPTLEHLAGLLRSRERPAEEPDQAAPAPRNRLRWLPWARRRPAADRPAEGPAAASGMSVFLLIWFGQLVSTLGTALGSFSLGIWIYERTQSTAQYTVMAFVAATTGLLLSPFAGAIADRWDRRKVMLFCDLGSGLMTALTAVLLSTGNLRPWHVYPMVAVMVTFGTFQVPALLASVSMLVPRRQLARASGMAQAAGSVSQIVGPLLAGFLVGRIGYHGILLLDASSFLFAASTLLFARIPRPPVSPERVPILRDALFGWRYIRERAGLLSLLSLFALTNFSLGMVQVLLTPLILSFATPVELGTVTAAGSAGSLLGAVLLSVWGGPQRRVQAIFGLMVFQSLLLFLGGKETSIPLITTATFAFMMATPVIAGCAQAIWQSKVALEVQGRVFAMRNMVASASLPIAYLLAGFLADQVFEPAMAPGGALAGSVGRLLGVGPGRGVGLLFVTLGLSLLVIELPFFLSRRLRHLETELPDAAPAATRP